MEPKQRENSRELSERRHILATYRLVIQSVHEAHSMRSVLEKEQQLRRLMRFLRRTTPSPSH
jgi:hypothetical protein